MGSPKNRETEIDIMISKLVELKNQLAHYAQLYEKTLQAFIMLVKLNNTDVDKILKHTGIAVMVDGKRIFPREQNDEGTYPQVVYNADDKN